MASRHFVKPSARQLYYNIYTAIILYNIVIKVVRIKRRELKSGFPFIPYFPDYKLHLFTKNRSRNVGCDLQSRCDLYSRIFVKIVESGIFLENVWPQVKRQDAMRRIQ